MASRTDIVVQVNLTGVADSKSCTARINIGQEVPAEMLQSVAVSTCLDADEKMDKGLHEEALAGYKKAFDAAMTGSTDDATLVVLQHAKTQMREILTKLGREGEIATYHDAPQTKAA